MKFNDNIEKRYMRGFVNSILNYVEVQKVVVKTQKQLTYNKKANRK